MSRSSPLVWSHADRWLIARAAAVDDPAVKSGRDVVWGGALTGLVLAALVVTSPLPVAASAVLLVRGSAPALVAAARPTSLLTVAPAAGWGLREPPALRARGALPSLFVRLRRGVGAQSSACVRPVGGP